MAMKARIRGRERLARELRAIAPEAEKEAAEEKLKVAQEAAKAIAARAPVGPSTDPVTGEPRAPGAYKASIRGGYQKDNPNAQRGRNQRQSKDPYAAAVFANYIWRFLEFGTRPHMMKSGIFAGKQHPGTEAQPHVFSVWREMRPKAKRKINSAVYRAIKRVRGK